ncbi:hypothetical protein BaRGS_00030955 [Batillaria attramentaria]|uniref:Uncharacterized protein n=1 Tax=Batillaria attramentaria TaxID=370345 RepID=A0ABD0JS00_9CAEN
MLRVKTENALCWLGSPSRNLGEYEKVTGASITSTMDQLQAANIRSLSDVVCLRFFFCLSCLLLLSPGTPHQQGCSPLSVSVSVQHQLYCRSHSHQSPKCTTRIGV